MLLQGHKENYFVHAMMDTFLMNLRRNVSLTAKTSHILLVESTKMFVLVILVLIGFKEASNVS